MKKIKQKELKIWECIQHRTRTYTRNSQHKQTNKSKKNWFACFCSSFLSQIYFRSSYILLVFEYGAVFFSVSRRWASLYESDEWVGGFSFLFFFISIRNPLVACGSQKASLIFIILIFVRFFLPALEKKKIRFWFLFCVWKQVCTARKKCIVYFDIFFFFSHSSKPIWLQ